VVALANQQQRESGGKPIGYLNPLLYQKVQSSAFKDIVPAISLRENERGSQIGAGWDPQWHQPTDLYSTYTDADFRLGLNAAQTTLAAIAELAGATIAK